MTKLHKNDHRGLIFLIFDMYKTCTMSVQNLYKISQITINQIIKKFPKKTYKATYPCGHVHSPQGRVIGAIIPLRRIEPRNPGLGGT
jgi:hypothetical protein